MAESKQEIPLYANSALKNLLDSFGSKLQEILAKYPVDTTSVEDTFSRKFLNTISELLTVITENCIPLVDKKKIPDDVRSLANAASAGDTIKDLVTKITSQMLTKESVVFEAIIKQLPNLIKNARKNLKKEKDGSLETEISKQIDTIKPELERISATIPGPKLEDLLEKFKTAINKYTFPEESKHDFSDLKSSLLYYEGRSHINEINLFHPMMVEFLIEVRNIISKAPDTIKELAPFLNPNLFKMYLVRKALSLAQIKITNTKKDLDDNFNISFEQTLPDTPVRTSTFLNEYREYKTKILNIIANLLNSAYQHGVGKTQKSIDDIIELFFTKTFERLKNEAKKGDTTKNTTLEPLPQWPPALTACITAYKEAQAATKFYMQMLVNLNTLEDSFDKNPQKTFVMFFTEALPDESLDAILLKPKQQNTSESPTEHKSSNTPEPPSKTSMLFSNIMLNFRFKEVALDSVSAFRNKFDLEQSTHIQPIKQRATDAEEPFKQEYQETINGFQQRLEPLEEQKSQPQTMEAVTKNTGTLAEIKQLNDAIDSYSKALQALPAKNFEVTEFLSPLTAMQSKLDGLRETLTKQNQEITRALALAACDTASLEQEQLELEKKILSAKAIYEQNIQQLEQEAKAEEDKLSQAQQTLLSEAKRISSQILNTLDPKNPQTSRIISNISDEIEYIRRQFKPNLDDLDLIEAKTITAIKTLIEPATARKNFPFEGITNYFSDYDAFLQKIAPFCVSSLDKIYHTNVKLRKFTDSLGSAFNVEKQEQTKKFETYKNSMMQGLNAMECFRNFKKEALPKLQSLHEQLVNSQKELERFRQATTTKKDSLTQANTQLIETMAKTNKCLELTISVFKSINALKKEMGQDNPSPCTWMELQQRHEELLENFNTLKGFESDNSGTITDIQSQIDSTTGQWQQAIKNRFIESLKKDIDILSTADAKIKELHQRLGKLSEATLVNEIPTFVKTIQDIHQEISTPIGSIKQALAGVTDRPHLQNLDIGQLQVQKQLNDCIGLLFKKRDQLLASPSEQELKQENSSWTTIKQQIEAVSFSELELMSLYQANDTELDRIKDEFHLIDKINNLRELTSVPDIAGIVLFSDIQTTINAKSKFNESIKRRIAKRDELCKIFLDLLEKYDQKKYNRLEDQQLIDLKEHYPASFIILDLKTLLKNYNNDACHRRVIEFIQKTLPHCTDIHLSSILNQIAIGLIDFNDEKPEYPSIESTKYTHKSALEKLRALGLDENATIMRNIYEQIEKIEKFAEALPANQLPEKEELLNLMRNAKRDVDTFILQNPLAKLTNFSPLVERLKFRLHSKDDVMSKHFRQWPRIIFNIITLPFLLVFKLPHSLYTTGKVRFFLAETDKEKQLKKLEDKVDNLLTPQGVLG